MAGDIVAYDSICSFGKEAAIATAIEKIPPVHTEKLNVETKNTERKRENICVGLYCYTFKYHKVDHHRCKTRDTGTPRSFYSDV